MVNSSRPRRRSGWCCAGAVDECLSYCGSHTSLLCFLLSFPLDQGKKEEGRGRGECEWVAEAGGQGFVVGAGSPFKTSGAVRYCGKKKLGGLGDKLGRQAKRGELTPFVGGRCDPAMFARKRGVNVKRQK